MSIAGYKIPKIYWEKFLDEIRSNNQSLKTIPFLSSIYCK